SASRKKRTYHVSPQFPFNKVFPTMLSRELNISSGFMTVNMRLARTDPVKVKLGVCLTMESNTFSPERTVNSPNPKRTKTKAMTKFLLKISGSSGRTKYTRAYQAKDSTVKGIISFKRSIYDQPGRKVATRSIPIATRGDSSLTRPKLISDSRARNSYPVPGC